MKYAAKTYLVLSLVVLIAASCGPVTPVPLATAMLTTKTVTTSTPVQVLTHTPTVVSTPMSSLPSSWKYVPPSRGPSAYQVKPWTAGDYSFFISSLNQGELFDSYPFFLPVFDSFYGFEYLLHVDDIDINDPSVWILAQIEPIGVPLPGMRKGEGYFNFLVEKLLNEENIPIGKLTIALKSHEFGVIDWTLVRDFYGKGEDAFFFDVFNDNGPFEPGMIFGIHYTDGFYQVDTLKNWEWMSGGGLGRHYIFEDVVDTNNNGFPELIVTEIEGHSGRPHLQQSTVWMYEWDNQKEDYRINSFPVYSQVCNEGACDGNWEVGSTDSTGIPTFIVQEYYNTQTECPTLTVQSTYRWDGKEYPLQQNSILPPSSEKAECLIAWSEAAIRLEDYGWQNDQAIQIISGALDQWPAAMDKDWGPASRDYFRLRLGIWKDLRGESAEALRLLEPLAARPFMSDYPVASQTAAAYLSERKNKGLINACQKANQTWSLAIEKGFPDPWNLSEIETVRNFLGFASDLWGYGTYDFSSVCSKDDAIFATARNLTSIVDVNPTNWFTSAGGSVYMTRQVDFDQDGRQDWLVIGETSSDTGFSSVWLFFNEVDHFDALQTDAMLDGLSPDLWRVLQPDEESDPVYAIHAGKSLWIFRVNRDKQVEILVDDYLVKLLEIDQKAGLRIKVSAADWDYQGEKIKNYVWDIPSQTFVTVVEEYDFENTRQKVERLIFQEHNYMSAISLIQQFLAEAPTEYLQTSSCEQDVCEYRPKKYYPNMYYLMGLAYEMTGQPEQAVRTYYFLWRDYPDSPYALLAQYKLEPISP